MGSKPLYFWLQNASFCCIIAPNSHQRAVVVAHPSSKREQWLCWATTGEALSSLENSKAAVSGARGSAMLSTPTLSNTSLHPTHGNPSWEATIPNLGLRFNCSLGLEPSCSIKLASLSSFAHHLPRLLRCLFPSSIPPVRNSKLISWF